MQGWFQMNIKKILFCTSCIFIISILCLVAVNNKVSDNISFNKEFISNVIISAVAHGPEGREEILITNNKENRIDLEPKEECEIDFLLPLFNEIKYPALLFETNAKNISIFLNNELIFKQETSSLLTLDKYPIILTFDKEDSLSSLKIRIENTSNIRSSFFIENFIFGDNYTLQNEYMLHDILSMSIFISLFGVAFITIFFSKFIPSQSIRIYITTLCAFILVNSLFQITISDSIYFFYNKPLIMKLFTNFILSVIPYFTYKFVDNIILVDNQDKWIKHFLIFSLISPIIFIILVTFDLFGISYLAGYTNEAVFFFYIILYFFALILTVLLTQRKNKNYNKVLFSFFIIFEAIFILQRIIDLHHDFAFNGIELLLIISALVMTIYAVLFCIKQKPSDLFLEDIFYDTFKDPLTNLLNRSAFEERILALDNNDLKNDWYTIAIDIDFMKVCNDTLGHAAGDELLTNFSKALVNTMSPYEGLGFRVGGDEFVVIIKKSDNFDINSFISSLEEEYSTTSTYKGSSFSYGYNLYRHNSGLKFSESLKFSDEHLLFNKAAHHKKLRVNDGFSKSGPKH